MNKLIDGATGLVVFLLLVARFAAPWALAGWALHWLING